MKNVALTDWDIGDGGQDITDLTALSDVELDPIDTRLVRHSQTLAVMTMSKLTCFQPLT